MQHSAPSGQFLRCTSKSLFPPGAAAAGLFGIVGMVGVLVAPVDGRLVDSKGAGQAILTDASAALLAWLVLAGRDSLAGLVLGVMLLDFGGQSALVAHQQVIYVLRPQARNRVITLFMVGMFLFGSLGSGDAMLAWKVAAWPWVAALAIAVVLSASIEQF